MDPGRCSATLNGQADVGGRTSIRLCSRESSAAAGTGAGSRAYLDVCRRDPTCYLDGLLDQYAEADVGQALAAPAAALCRLGGAADVTPQKAVPHRALTEGVLAIADSRREAVPYSCALSA